MYALSADTFTIRQKVTRKMASQQEHPLKTSLKIGPARLAEAARKILRRNTDSRKHKKEKKHKIKKLIFGLSRQTIAFALDNLELYRRRAEDGSHEYFH